MAVKIVSTENIQPVKLPGRDLQWIANALTIGSEQLSIAIMNCPAKSIVRPMHSHTEVEEIILILAGEGEAWVDGELGRFKKGDAVLFPANSKHQVRNTGDGALLTASIFATADAPSCYVMYDEDAFEEGEQC